MLALLKRLLDESMSDGFNFDCAAVDETLLFGQVPVLRVVTKQHEEFVVRVEEV
jgi:hypothetical protein